HHPQPREALSQGSAGAEQGIAEEEDGSGEQRGGDGMAARDQPQRSERDQQIDGAGDAAATEIRRRQGKRLARRLGQPCSQRAASAAEYVRIRSAPARLMPVRISRQTRFSSIHPRSAAALSIEYSPETL